MNFASVKDWLETYMSIFTGTIKGFIYLMNSFQKIKVKDD